MSQRHGKSEERRAKSEERPAAQRRRSSLLALRSSLIWLLVLSFLATLALGQEYRPGELIVAVRPGVSIQLLSLVYGLLPLEQIEGTNLWRVRALLAPVTDILTRLLADLNVEFADLNYILSTPESGQQDMAFVDGDRPPYVEGESPPRYFSQPAYSRIMADQAHSITTGAGIVVAVVDTGTSFTHPALQARMLAGWDFVDNDPDPTDEPDGRGYGHGTFISGIIALVAPDAQILPVRALNPAGRGDVFTVAKAIRYAVDQGAQVINLSVGLPRRVQAVDAEIHYAHDAGVVVVASAGNQNSGDPQYPAASQYVMGVAAVTDQDVKWDFSNFNERLSVSAPGVTIYSAFPADRFARWSGTSFSAAFVAGEVALIQALYPSAGPADIENIIQQSTDNIDQLNPDYVGRLGSGRINCLQAVQ